MKIGLRSYINYLVLLFILTLIFPMIANADSATVSASQTARVNIASNTLPPNITQPSKTAWQHKSKPGPHNLDWWLSADGASWALFIVASIAGILGYRTLRATEIAALASKAAAESALEQSKVAKQMLSIANQSQLVVGDLSCSLTLRVGSTTRLLSIETILKNIGQVHSSVTEISSNFRVSGNRGEAGSDVIGAENFSLFSNDAGKTVELFRYHVPEYNLSNDGGDWSGHFVAKIRYEDAFSTRERYIHAIVKYCAEGDSVLANKVETSAIARDIEVGPPGTKVGREMSLKKQFGF